MEQTIYLSLPKAERAIKSKKDLEALAFAVLIKLTFTSSEIQSASVRKCKDIFNIGTTRMTRVINNSIKYGYVVREGETLKALKVKDGKAFNIKLTFESKSYSRSTERYSLNFIMDKIRNSVLLNHIKKQNNCEDTFDMASKPESIKTYRKAKKRIKCMSRTETAFTGLSINRIAKLLGVGLNKARVLLNNLLSCSLITKSEHSIKTPFGLSDLSPMLREWFKETGAFGYLYRGSDGVYCRVSNSYTYSCELIQWMKTI